MNQMKELDKPAMLKELLDKLNKMFVDSLSDVEKYKGKHQDNLFLVTQLEAENKVLRDEKTAVEQAAATSYALAKKAKKDQETTAYERDHMRKERDLMREERDKAKQEKADATERLRGLIENYDDETQAFRLRSMAQPTATHTSNLHPMSQRIEHIHASMIPAPEKINRIFRKCLPLIFSVVLFNLFNSDMYSLRSFT